MRKIPFILSVILVSNTAVFAGKECSTKTCCESGCLEQGLLLYLPLDGGDTEDRSGQDRQVTKFEAIPGQGEFADSFWFDGIDDYLKVADFEYGPEYSVSFWFNSSTNAGRFYQYMFSHGKVHMRNTANYYFVEDSNKSHGGQIKTNHLDEDDIEASELLFTDVGLSDGTWHHYTVTVGEKGTKVYLDGKFWRTAPDLGGDPINPEGDIFIGSRWDRMKDRSYEGYLDDIRLYDRTLTAEEVGKLSCAGR